MREQSIGKKLYNASKKIHKVLGLALCVLLIWMSVSGILLNHPEAIHKASIGKSFFPEEYIPQNWNRSTINDALFISDNNIFFAGKQGIWKSYNGGETFSPATQEGFTSSPYFGKTNDLHYIPENDAILASTYGGLWHYDLKQNIWSNISDKLIGKTHFIKCIRIENNIIAISKNDFYKIDITNLNHIEKVTPKKQRSAMDLISFTFALHSGWLWGYGGRIAYDIISLFIIFFSISGIYIFIINNKKKPKKATALTKKTRKFMFQKHAKWGLWLFAFLLIIGGTGLFMRPPLLVALADGKVPVKYLPKTMTYNPWYHTIRNALYDQETDRIILDTTEGLFAGPSDMTQEFKPIDWNTNIFVMGATVFEPIGNGKFNIGSFYGLYEFDENKNISIDKITGKPAPKFNGVQRPGRFMTTSYFSTPNGDEYICSFGQGLLPLTKPENNYRFKMPDEIVENANMPLWNYMFELHNGRLFTPLLGKWTILFIPLTAMAFILLTLAGAYEVAYRKFHQKSKRKKPSPVQKRRLSKVNSNL
ncbi:PepSY-associated TM helix domain-containing protein [Aureibacter tunicatorum]|uniref:PepSY domain-containing protein n=1 Tax=Aureibacter tunicatorum TaxID=866807 RepID=A0AAE4BTP8_9BACT|nr:PepSY-associated TM helix domain-containing protein [Aureibacter tunicatorum]MDR6240028.1 hypothetical protein [Aureibacter tunicatorum]BDD04500.1 iron-regulated protein [Aureibacter tunicatorum]